jgi:exodeoxyribonuclease V beta subunit
MIANRKAFDVFSASLTGSNLIEASAGTGKTWSITGLYLRMVVEQNLLPENILVVTFTKAATAELTGRIRERLQQAMSWQNGHRESNEADFFNELFEQWEGEISNTEVKQRLLRALARFDQAAIFTIHSFCQRLLNDYAFEAGGRFNLTLMSEGQDFTETVIADFWRTKVSTLDKDDEVWAFWLVQQKQSPAVWLKEIKNFINRPYQKILPPEQVPPVDEALVQRVIQHQTTVSAEWKNNSKEIIADLAGLMEDGLLNGTSYKIKALDTYVIELSAFLQKGLTTH